MVVRFDCMDEQAAVAFDRLTAETMREIAAREPGTLVYATHPVHDEPLSRVFYELYRNREAFGEHERQPHVRRFLTQRERYLTGHRVEFLASGLAIGLDFAP